MGGQPFGTSASPQGGQRAGAYSGVETQGPWWGKDANPSGRGVLGREEGGVPVGSRIKYIKCGPFGRMLPWERVWWIPDVMC